MLLTSVPWRSGDALPCCAADAHGRPTGFGGAGRSLRMNQLELLQAMTDAYIARRRKGGEFDGIAATQAFWECRPQMSVG